MSTPSEPPEPVTDDDYESDSRPSKSQRKREAHAQQELGQRLTSLSSSVLDGLSLSGELRAAIEQYKSLPNSRGAQKRQLQFIGRLMRDCDCDAIENELQRPSREDSTANIGKSTRLASCERVLEQGDPAIESLLLQHPHLSRQKLRQLHRQYHRETDESRRRQISEKLFNYLK